MNVSQSVSKKSIALLLDLLAQAHRIAIVCHARPDGDAVGSMTALAQVLATRGHDVLCIAPTAVPAPLRWVAGFELVKTFSLDGQYISRELPSVQLFFHVDHNSLSRVDPQLEQALRACNAQRVMIDHHLIQNPPISLSASHARNPAPHASCSTKSYTARGESRPSRAAWRNVSTWAFLPIRGPSHTPVAISEPTRLRERLWNSVSMCPLCATTCWEATPWNATDFTALPWPQKPISSPMGRRPSSHFPTNS